MGSPWTEARSGTFTHPSSSFFKSFFSIALFTAPCVVFLTLNNFLAGGVVTFCNSSKRSLDLCSTLLSLSRSHVVVFDERFEKKGDSKTVNSHTLFQVFLFVFPDETKESLFLSPGSSFRFGYYFESRHVVNIDYACFFRFSINEW